MAFDLTSCINAIFDAALKKDSFWTSFQENWKEQSYAIHLAILIEPYLRDLLEGNKLIESRFSRKRIAPFDRAMKGDVILLKQSSGPIVGLCLINQVEFYFLNAQVMANIREKYSKSLCIKGESFWEEHQASQYASLMWVIKPTCISPIPFEKHDPRGWVVLQSRQVRGQSIQGHAKQTQLLLFT